MTEEIALDIAAFLKGIWIMLCFITVALSMVAVSLFTIAIWGIKNND